MFWYAGCLWSSLGTKNHIFSQLSLNSQLWNERFIDIGISNFFFYPFLDSSHLLVLQCQVFYLGIIFWVIGLMLIIALNNLSILYFCAPERSAEQRKWNFTLFQAFNLTVKLRIIFVNSNLVSPVTGLTNLPPLFLVSFSDEKLWLHQQTLFLSR